MTSGEMSPHILALSSDSWSQRLDAKEGEKIYYYKQNPNSNLAFTPSFLLSLGPHFSLFDFSILPPAPRTTHLLGKEHPTHLRGMG